MATITVRLFYTCSLFLMIVSTTNAKFKVPEALIEPLSPKGFRVSIPDVDGIRLFAFHANLNKDIEELEGGKFSVDINEAENGRWTYINRVTKLKLGDVFYYWLYVDYFDGERVLGYRLEGQTFTVTELLNSATQRPQCIPANTKVNGKTSCIGTVILEDHFQNSNIDLSKWMFEHKIPISGENSEFNSYQNLEETHYFKDSILHLRPIALTEDTDVRGVLDLTVGCTSTNPNECYYTQVSAFLIPPVKSAKMNSLIKFKYGRIDIRAKLPAGDWIVPIMELTAISNDNFANKIWIAYSRGNNHLRGISGDDIGSRVLFAGPVSKSCEADYKRQLISRQSPNPFSSDYNVYSVLWTPAGMIFYINNEKYGEVPRDFSEDEFYLSLGVLVGGLKDFPDNYTSDSGPKPWLNYDRNTVKKFFDARNNWLPTWNGDDTALKIDYVKIVAV